MKTLLPITERVARFAMNRRGIASRYVHTPVAPIHVYDAMGKGPLPTTVMLHGIGSAGTPFARVIEGLRHHVRRVIAPEMPGHGFSGIPAERFTPDRLYESVAGALDNVLTEPAIVCGNSLGGALALRYAVDHPERVAGLVLLSPAGARMTDEEWDALMRSFRFESMRGAMEFMARLYHRRPWFAPMFAPDLRRVFDSRPIRDLLETASPFEGPTPEQIGALRMPVMLLWGKSERLLPSSNLEYFRRVLPKHAIVEEPAGYGHCPHFDAPRDLVNRIVDFARRVPPIGLRSGAEAA